MWKSHENLIFISYLVNATYRYPNSVIRRNTVVGVKATDLKSCDVGSIKISKYAIHPNGKCSLIEQNCEVKKLKMSEKNIARERK